ncbi:molybdopterin synthase sulfur carrier subunit [Halobacillus halophilus]|uniref:Molybdopterin synthase sulfur carrier subunit n=1 Tax=Halobacillus halophilus (strain ATCC 35676 / DSM 2266 / JCM 20832 / KCTC 3685 / LMG 17431 / NBRC 102448 / NCIMB 2269) TaxID=866895 RepID=I0JKG8_HALH3|nr:molybdopterin converting factor subunit 1 [Halobacillus halophilus]ASF38781.1 molybdopterin synthase sulfur carrier subunit [Halobacillus halophilus]CCG44637.1 molybdopterin synthase sulfur carrier subunit MoaD [Halobacillus halophilus DSM 2266]
MNQILFFAGLREQAGEESIELDVNGRSIGELKETLSSRYAIDKVKESMTAVNEEFVQDEEIIKEGDTIAFIPPVSGG